VKHFKSVEFYQISECKGALNNRKAPLLKTFWRGSDLEKWLNILGFTDFKPLHFVVKYHTPNASQKSHLCRLFLGKYYFSRYSRFMTQMRIETKTNLKADSFAIFEKSRFHHGATKLT